MFSDKKFRKYSKPVGQELDFVGCRLAYIPSNVEEMLVIFSREAVRLS
jgi:hypothetical protein